MVLLGDFVLFPLAPWLRMISPRTRRLLALHGLDLIYGRRRGWKPRIYRCYVALARRLAGAVDHFVANSSATAAVAEQMGFRPVSAVPLGVALPDFVAPEPAAGMPSSGGRPILFVGRIVPRKGLAWFAEQVLPRLPGNVQLEVVGSAWDAGELERATQCGRVRYLGRVPDATLSTLRRRAIVTVMPNRSLGGSDIEGFGLAALEAAADGSVLLASAIEGIIDAVIDGKTGFLLPEGDAEAWAARILDVLAWSPERRSAFVAGARAVLATRYSWDRVARETLALAGPLPGATDEKQRLG